MSAVAESIIPVEKGAPLGSLVPKDKEKPDADEYRIRRSRTFPPLLKYLRNTCDAVASLDREARLDIYRLQVKSHHFYAGQMCGNVDDAGHWHRSDRPEDQIYIDPKYQYHVDTALVEVARSRTELNVLAMTDDPVLKEVADYAKARLEDVRRRFMGAGYTLREALFLILSGTSFRETYFSSEAGPWEQLPVSSRRQVGSGVRAKVCDYCGAPIECLPCPQCGGSRERELSSESFEAPVVTKYEKVRGGDVRSLSVDPAEVNIALRARDVSQSPFIEHTSLVMRALLESLFDCDIPSTGITDTRLRLQRELETGKGSESTSAGDTKSDHSMGGEQFELLESRRTWLDPYVYQDYVAPEEETLPSGSRIEKGARLIELYPKGMRIWRAGDKILDLRAESKNCRWAGMPFRPRPTSIYGGGFEHLIPLQEQANILRSLQFVDVHYNSVMREIVNTQTGLTADDISNNPGEVIEVDQLGPEYSLQNAYSRSSPSTSLAQTMPLVQEIDGNMQASAGTFGSQGSMADDKLAGTATGAAIRREMQTGRYSPPLWLRSEADAEQGYQILELEQQNWSDERFSKIMGRYGERAVKAFRACDIRTDLRIEPVPGSWMPQSDVERTARTEAYVGLVTKAGRPLDDDLLSLVADAYHVPHSAAEHSVVERIVEENIAKLTAVVEFLESQGHTDAQFASVAYQESGINISLLLENHDEMIGEYHDYHLSDEGRRATPLMKASIEVAAEAHVKAKAALEGKLKELAASAAVPAVQVEQEAQLEAQAAQAQAGQQMQAQQGEQQMQAQAAQAEQGLAIQGAAQSQELAGKTAMAEVDVMKKMAEAQLRG